MQKWPNEPKRMVVAILCVFHLHDSRGTAVVNSVMWLKETLSFFILSCLPIKLGLGNIYKRPLQFLCWAGQRHHRCLVNSVLLLSHGHKTAMGTKRSGCSLFFLEIMQWLLGYYCNCSVIERWQPFFWSVAWSPPILKGVVKIFSEITAISSSSSHLAAI